MARRKMTAKQLRYFGPRRKRSTRAAPSTRRRSVSMARRRSFKRSGGSRGFNGGGMKSLLAPILGGVADAALDSRIPVHGVGSTAVGMFLHNETVKTIGLYQVGHSLAQYIPFIGGGAGSGGITQV